jgi:hypothetical protein
MDLLMTLQNVKKINGYIQVIMIMTGPVIADQDFFMIQKKVNALRVTLEDHAKLEKSSKLLKIVQFRVVLKMIASQTE